jgi:hypothetical protein
MTDFIYDNTPLPNGKVDAGPLDVPPNQAVVAAEWNLTLQGLLDARAALLTGQFHGMSSNPGAAVSPSGGVRIRSNSGALEVSENGAPYATVSTPGLAASNRDMTCLVTTADHQPAVSIGLASMPRGWVEVRVKGWGVSVGNGTRAATCYFSGDGGATARAMGGLRAGDLLYWVGSMAGFELDVTDTISVLFEL